MAIVHKAELRPTKLELLARWLPTRPWYQGPATPDVQKVASFRFDDPDGEVGIETLLVRADDGPVLQVPLTYRGAPLAGREEWLVGTTDHSVLGPRWVYDACGDPAYASVLASTIFTGAAQADEFVQSGDGFERRDSSASATGSGYQVADVPTVTTIVRSVDADPTLIVTDSVELAVIRVIPAIADQVIGEKSTLTGTWEGRSAPVLLVEVR